MQPLILDVQINGQAVEATHPLVRRGAQILFAKSELDAWQLITPAGPVVSLNGNDYYDLLVLPGIKFLLDEATQTMKLEIPPKLFRDSLAKTRLPARLRLNRCLARFSTTTSRSSTTVPVRTHQDTLTQPFLTSEGLQPPIL